MIDGVPVTGVMQAGVWLRTPTGAGTGSTGGHDVRFARGT
jgi:hypothetical protein